MTAKGVELSTLLKTTGANAFEQQVTEYLGGGTTAPDLASKQAKTGKIRVSIVGGKIRVWISSSTNEEAVAAKKTKDSTGKAKLFSVPTAVEPESTT